MRSVLFFLLLLPALATAQVGGSGTCHVSGNPNTVLALEVQDMVSGCLTAIDTLTGDLYAYNPSLAQGSRWVKFVNQTVSEGYGTNVTNVGNDYQVEADTNQIATQYDLTQLTDRSIYAGGDTLSPGLTTIVMPDDTSGIYFTYENGFPAFQIYKSANGINFGTPDGSRIFQILNSGILANIDEHTSSPTKVMVYEGAEFKYVPIDSISDVTGSGTVNFVPRWTPDGNTLGDSRIQDNGTTFGFNTVPSGSVQFNFLGDAIWDGGFDSNPFDFRTNNLGTASWDFHNSNATAGSATQLRIGNSSSLGAKGAIGYHWNGAAFDTGNYMYLGTNAQSIRIREVTGNTEIVSKFFLTFPTYSSSSANGVVRFNPSSQEVVIDTAFSAGGGTATLPMATNHTDSAELNTARTFTVKFGLADADISNIVFQNAGAGNQGGTFVKIVAREAEGCVQYTPPNNYTGRDTIKYAVVDTQGDTSYYNRIFVDVVDAFDTPTGGGTSGYGLTNIIATGTTTVDFLRRPSGYFQISMGSTAEDELTFSNPDTTVVPTYRLHWQGVTTDTVTFPANVYDYTGVALGSRILPGDTFLECYYDKADASYFCSDTIGLSATVPPGSGEVAGITVLDGIRAHYSSDLSVTTAADTVSVWGDLSGNGYDLTPIANLTGGPNYLTNQQNGKPAIEFGDDNDATLDYENILANTAFPAMGDSSRTIVIVSDGQYFGENGSGFEPSTNHYFSIGIGTKQVYERYTVGISNTAEVYRTEIQSSGANSTLVPDTANYEILVVTHDRATVGLAGTTMHLNSFANSSTLSGGIAPNTTTGLITGAHVDSSATAAEEDYQAGNHKCLRIIVYNRKLSQAEIETVISELKTYYNIP